MAELDFSDLIPKAANSPSSQGLSFDDLIPKLQEPEAADHGLSERQKLSPVGKALSPITSYPATYDRMNKESREQMSRGVEQLSNPESLIDPKAHGISDVLTGAGNVALGGLGYVASPISAAYRSIAGQPIEDVTGIPREQTEFALQLATPGIGLPGTVKAPAPNLPRVVIDKPNEIVDASRRISEVAQEPVNVPRAFSSDNMAVQRAAQGVRNVPIVGDAIPKATGEMADQLGGAVRTIADEYGSGSGPNVASRISNTIGTGAEREAQAAKAAAETSDAAVLADWERAHTNTRNAIGAAETNVADTARRTVGDMSPQDMGATIAARLRQGEQEARATKERLYGIAGNSDASIEANAVRNIRKDVSKSLDEQGLFVDANLTPAAARMVQELDNVPVQNVVSPRAAEGPKPLAPKPTAPRPGEPAPQSLTEFLASKGGLGPDAELEAIGAHNHTVNVEGLGRRKLTRQGGLPLDSAREAAEEAGYLRGDHKGTSTVNDLLDAIDAEMRGNKRYAQGHEGTVNRREAVARSEREQHDYAQHRSARQEDIAASDFPGDRAGGGRPVSVQGLEQTRKLLGAMKQAASNDADRRAAGHVMRAYDDWIDNAFDNALFSGSDEALGAYKQARAANADWRTRFGYNSRDDADKLVNRIVTGEVTPQEVSNWLVGSTQVGAKGVSSRLLTRVAEATGGDAEAMQAIRGGVWNRLSQSTAGVDAKGGTKVANDINEFLQGSGRDVANKLFTPVQQGVMRTYAETLRRGAQARETLTEAAANTKPSISTPQIGPIQELASAVLGKGGKSDEALFNAVDTMAKSSGRADVKTLADIVRNIPAQDRGDLAGAMIRKLGQSKQTNSFSLDMFASQWKDYTPQAKAVLFGNAGPHVQALNDIATISQRYKDIGKRFGNPSGTSQNRNFAAMAGAITGIYASPFTAIPMLLGGGGGLIVAKMLAAPAGASSIAKWGRASMVAQASPTPQRLVAFQIASRNLSNTASGFGSNVSPADLMKLIQSPRNAAADDQQQNVPRRVGK